MKIAEINMVHYGSTGKIMFYIAECARTNGFEVRTFSPKFCSVRKKPVFIERMGHTYFGYTWEYLLHRLCSTVTGLHGCFSYFSTKQLLKRLDEFQPDVIHLHNLHNWTINVPMLFRYIKNHQIKTVWTLHDCWSFTGQCPYFTMVGCDKWQSGCHDCPQIREYPNALVDRTRLMWKQKRKWLTGVPDMTIVTPSDWLAGLVKRSFLSEYPVRVIHNGIDLNTFQPTASDFREKHGLEQQKLVLAVSFAWGARKGLDVLIELSRRLPETYHLVLVGTDDETDRQLPDTVLSIHQTNNQRELAEIYSAADVFVMPTREENYPTVNMEALACGTPVITFRTGGSPEIVDESCGIVVDCDDIDAMEKAIYSVCETGTPGREACLARAGQFEQMRCYREYCDLYAR